MRRLTLSVLALSVLAGCQQAAADDAQSVDINAAAVRAQNDVSHYAAMRAEPSRKTAAAAHGRF